MPSSVLRRHGGLVVPGAYPVLGRHQGRAVDVILTQWSDNFPIAMALRYGGIFAANQTWPTTQFPIAFPFVLAEPFTVYQLGWVNGSGTMTDSFDIGIYDTSWNRKVAGGGTVRTGANLVQWVDVGDTVLGAGSYYLVGSQSGTTASQLSGLVANAVVLNLMGTYYSTTAAYPLPDPLTNMVGAASFSNVALMMIAGRATV